MEHTGRIVLRYTPVMIPIPQSSDQITESFLKQREWDKLYYFITNVCRLDRNQRIGHDALERHYNEYRTIGGTYADLYTRGNSFSEMMKIICTMYNIEYRRYNTGWCYKGLCIGADNPEPYRFPSLPIERWKENKRTYDGSYYQQNKEELAMKRRVKDRIFQELQRAGFSLDELKVLKKHKLYTIIYRNGLLQN